MEDEGIEQDSFSYNAFIAFHGRRGELEAMKEWWVQCCKFDCVTACMRARMLQHCGVILFCFTPTIHHIRRHDKFKETGLGITAHLANSLMT